MTLHLPERPNLEQLKRQAKELLFTALEWATVERGILWLLDHGAAADPVFGGTGETPLHRAAARWGIDVIAALVRRGAEINRRRNDQRTPYAIAEINGNRPAAEWLRTHGAVPDVCDVDCFVAACRRADGATVKAMLATRPGLPDELTPEHHAGFHHAAETGDLLDILDRWRTPVR